MWAREEYFYRRVTTSQLARKYGMGRDAVGRMLRGDTYANVGDALPRAEEVQAVLGAEGGRSGRDAGEAALGAEGR